MAFATVGEGRPLLGEQDLSSPDAVVEFESRGNRIVVTARTPTVPQGLSQSFGPRGGKRYGLPAHLGCRPWYLRFPKTAAPEYIEHLCDVREWRGELGVRHLAPLAFLPPRALADLAERVPEAARINRRNREFLMLYALLTPDRRRKLETADGICPKELKMPAYLMLLGILGYPTTHISRQDYLEGRLTLRREQAQPELDCEFRFKYSRRLVLVSLRSASGDGASAGQHRGAVGK